MTRRRWLLYLLLNVLVSALVTLSILYLYDRRVREEQATLFSMKATVTALPPAALSENALQIVVLAAGDLPNERVLIRYTGPLGLDLSAWRLKDEEGHLYVFPPFTLVSGGAVQIHTIAGKDTPVDLYWGLSQPVWQSGETLTLLDSGGTPRLIYIIP
ncbi:MAG: lamin tail domain-containing protein [Anaerolineales bacterium]